MKYKMARTLGAILVAIAFGLAVVISASAQGRGRGGGSGGGRGSGMGQPSGVGVDRGLGRSSDASNGRADAGRNNASVRSNGRSDAGLDRARIASGNLSDANRDLVRHPGITNVVHTNANNLRSQYQVALINNPNLKFGQFVAATRLAQNLGGRHPNITRDAILAGLASGRSIGQTLQDLGLSSHDAKAAKKQTEKEIEQARR
jgi:hypothetical protein